MNRRYYEPLQACAAEIASEVVVSGKSTGWSGSIESCETVREILRPFNIEYVDDMSGEYKPVGPRKDAA